MGSRLNEWLVMTYTADMTQDDYPTRRIFTGVKFAVDQITVPTRDGSTAVRERITHPGAVVVLPITQDDRVVMIRNHRFAVGQTLWELCAGTLEPPEPPAACAGRELIEETGYEAGRIESLCQFYTTPGMTNELMHAFVAHDLKHVGQQLEATEQIEVELVPRADVLQMVRTGEIVDAKSIAALLYHQAFESGK